MSHFFSFDTMSERDKTEQVDTVIPAEPSIIENLNEKSLNKSGFEEIQDKTVAIDDRQRTDQNRVTTFAQTPYYYEQQTVAGRPVYVDQGEPVNVRNTPAYREGRTSFAAGDDDEYYSSIGSFDNKRIRHAFVRKVYMLLTLQLLFTFGFILLSSLVKEVEWFLLDYYYLTYIALVGMVILTCALSCSTSLRRSTPLNFIILALVTAFFAYTFAFISVFYSTYIILIAIGLTFAACVCITIFAIQTSWDITKYGLYLCVGTVILFLFGTIAMIINYFTSVPVLHTVYAGLIGLLFSFYLIYDTQQIVGGRRVEISPEEYIMGALQLYIDVMYIFYCMLQLLGRK